MKCHKIDGNVSFVRLGDSKPKTKSGRIEINKLYSKLNHEVTVNVKKDYCYLCEEKCTSFRNSHSIPKFILSHISENGQLLSYIRREMSPEKNDFGENNAGTFQFICENCENSLFRDYEQEDAYLNVPTNKMLSQIALKNYLHMIWKRQNEIEFYKVLKKHFPQTKQMVEEKLFFAKKDLYDYTTLCSYARKILKQNSGNGYDLLFYIKLDYVVPYASQAAITLFSDFEDNIVNNIFSFSSTDYIENINIAVFPLKSSSVILAFVEKTNTRYKEFFKQLNNLSLEDQLASINYIIFANTENVFVHRSLYELVNENEYFRDVCKLTFDYKSNYANPNPYGQAMKEFSLSNRHKIPNLLSKEYALG